MATEKLSLEDLDRMIAKAKSATPALKPLVIEGKECLVLMPQDAGPEVDGMLDVDHPDYGPGRAYPV
jgi:hypothetical protein